MYSLEILLNTIIQTYLNQSYCLVYVSNNDFNCNFNVPVIRIKSTPSNSNKTSVYYHEFQKRIENSLDKGCGSYMVYNSNFLDFLQCYDLSSQLTLQKKGNRRFIYIVNYIDIDMNVINEILTSKIVKYIPDFIIIYPNEFVARNADNENSNLFYDVHNAFQAVKSFKIVTRKMDDPELVLLDYWFAENQLFLYNEDLFPFKVKDLYKMPLITNSMTTYPPYVILEKVNTIIYPNKELKEVADGIEIRLFREYGKRYNITLNITVEENLWGQIYYNRTGTFMYGRLLEDKIDCMHGAMGTWLKIWILLEFAQPHVVSKIACIVPIPNDFSESFYIMYGLTVLQPLPDSVAQYSNNAFRNLLIWILLQTLIISTTYTSGLTSIMTLPQYEEPIRTTQDLIDSKMEWGSNDDSWIEALIISDQPKIIELLKTYRVYTDEELTTNVPEKFGYLVEELAIGEGTGSFTIPEYISEEALLKSQTMEEEIYWTNIRTFWRKNSPFLPTFNDLTIKCRESGLLFAFQTQAALKYMNVSIQLHLKGQEKEISDDPVVLTIYDLESVFAIWLVGIIISCISFGVEILKK
ncbi:uncharacterized protein LOC123292862 [Chrysoperla carnea]|uniref:uncharacterized protein LOC123292862 n=1 Tax=Chrysoperla carnea TaxID=189513 RepID=UPI001D067495|nr:uncharacterized protein LOC123292862 [Chrysoperla carnea]